MLAVGLAALVIAFALGGTRSQPRLEGSNSVGVGQFVIFLKPQQELCQREGRLPAGIASLRMTIGTYGKPGPKLRTSVETAGVRALPVGRLAAGWTEGPIDVPLGAVPRRPLSTARICIANRSDVRLAFAGARVDRASGARVAGQATSGRVGLQYVRARPQSGWELTERVTTRMTVGNGLWGGLAPWAAITFVLLAAGAAVRGLLAGVGRS